MKITYATAIKLENSLKQVPFKGLAVIDAAVNLVILAKPLKVVDETKTQLLKKHNGGKNTFDNTETPEFKTFLSEFEELLSVEIEVSGVKTIKTDNIDTTRQAGQEAIAELLKAGILE